MNAEQTITVDREIVDQVLGMWGKLNTDIETATREMVKVLSGSNKATIDLAAEEMLKANRKRDWVKRIAACAKRGLVEATHLYGSIRIATAAMIEDASTKAIDQLADPEFLFPVLSYNTNKRTLETRLKKASDLSCNDLALCWDRNTGMIDEKQQRKHAKKRMMLFEGTVTKSQKPDLKHILSAIPFSDKQGNQCIEIRSQVDGIQTSDCYVLKELKRIVPKQ